MKFFFNFLTPLPLYPFALRKHRESKQSMQYGDSSREKQRREQRYFLIPPFTSLPPCFTPAP